MALTVVIEVGIGTPKTLAIRIPKPMKNRTATPAGSEISMVMMSPLSVSMTFRPTVHPPRKTKPTISPAAVTLRRTPAPTAGPHAMPVEEPPMLKPTNSEARIPAVSTVTTIQATSMGSQK